MSKKRKHPKRKSKQQRSMPKPNPLEFELEWKATWIAVDFQRRRKRQPSYFQQFVAEQGMPLAEACQCLDGKLLLWHGTTLERAQAILREGFFCPKGIWMTENAQQAHSIAHFQAKRWKDLPAILISMMDKEEFKEGEDYEIESPGVYKFHGCVPSMVIQYLLTPEGLQLVGKNIDKD